MPFIDTQTIITNNALCKMAEYGLNEDDVKDAFHHPDRWEWSKISGAKSFIKTYKYDEVGVIASQRKDGVWTIISVWHRKLMH